jgi:hypothetical protein
MMQPKSIAPKEQVTPSASLYVNHFGLAHNQYEFLIELGQYRPSKDNEEGSLAVHTCLALAPPYAKMLSDLLSRAVQQHERDHGVIAPVSASSPAFDIVFQALPEVEARARDLRSRERNALERSNGAKSPQRSNQDR